MSLAYKNFASVRHELDVAYLSESRLMFGWKIGSSMTLIAIGLTFVYVIMGTAKCSSATSVKATLPAKFNAVASSQSNVIDYTWT